MMEELSLPSQITIKAKFLAGLVARKDLSRRLAQEHLLPTYVTEPILARRLAAKAPEGKPNSWNTDSEDDPYEGQAAEEALSETFQLLSEEAATPGDEEIIGLRARQEGFARVIGHIEARHDARSDSYLAELSPLDLGPMPIDSGLVQRYHGLLMEGFYARVEIEPEASGPGKYRVGALDPIQRSGVDGASEEKLVNWVGLSRSGFRHTGWAYFLFQSLGLDPFTLSEEALEAILLRLVPFVVKNYNLIELGPRGTGKSHLYGQVTPRAHVLSSGKATAAQLFVHSGTGEPGLVTTREVVCFDEVAEVSFRDRNGITALRGYMESGQFGRGKRERRGEASLVFLGNLPPTAVEQFAGETEEGHLLRPLPAKLQNDTAFMARLHAFVPGWHVPKIGPEHLTDGLGLTYGTLADLFSQLRERSRIEEFKDRVELSDALNGRDRQAVWKTIDGLMKLLLPDSGMALTYPVEYVVDLALRPRRRVKEQQRQVRPEEYGDTAFRYRVDGEGEMKEAVPAELEPSRSGSSGSEMVSPG